MFLIKYLILSKFLCVNKGGHNHNKQILTKFLFLESFVKYVNYEYFFFLSKQRESQYMYDNVCFCRSHLFWG